MALELWSLLRERRSEAEIKVDGEAFGEILANLSSLRNGPSWDEAQILAANGVINLFNYHGQQVSIRRVTAA